MHKKLSKPFSTSSVAWVKKKKSLSEAAAGCLHRAESEGLTVRAGGLVQACLVGDGQHTSPVAEEMNARIFQGVFLK